MKWSPDMFRDWWKRTTVVLCILVASTAAARPPQRWDDDTLHILARTLVGEADWHERDYAPIAYVLERRWRTRAERWDGATFGDYMRMYSAVWKSGAYRPQTIQLLPWAAHNGPWGGSRWDRVRAWVRSWARGLVADPCPNAMQWGGTMDRPHGHWRPVDCGRTVNIFYKIEGR